MRHGDSEDLERRPAQDFGITTQDDDGRLVTSWFLEDRQMSLSIAQCGDEWLASIEEFDADNL